MNSEILSKICATSKYEKNALTRYFIIKSGSFYTNWDNLGIFADWSYGRQEKNRYKIGAEARI